MDCKIFCNLQSFAIDHVAAVCLSYINLMLIELVDQPQCI